MVVACVELDEVAFVPGRVSVSVSVVVVVVLGRMSETCNGLK